MRLPPGANCAYTAPAAAAAAAVVQVIKKGTGKTHPKSIDAVRVHYKCVLSSLAPRLV